MKELIKKLELSHNLKDCPEWIALKVVVDGFLSNKLTKLGCYKIAKKGNEYSKTRLQNV